MTTRPHGYARYKLDGCRCNTCGWAVATYRDHREHLIRRGQWQPYVDAAPARAHVVDLKACGLGERTIAALASLDRKRIRDLTHGRPERGTPPPAQIRPATALAILNVEPTIDILPGSLIIDATGSIRRLQALTAAGWPQAQLADRIGSTPGNISALLRRDRTIVRTARAVRSSYNELWSTDPLTEGVTAQAVARARNHARANGWAPVGAWDDDTIDDPAAVPDWTGECGTAAGYWIHRREGIPRCQPCIEARAAQRQQHAA
ncbi:hypothetical protein ACGFZP_05255 [Kitasatospora sp. NPDC048239]|uniref:hypothetical protein n=1 Tax=Kitasatospora sp. NPDC048239 TaxID=3364046 RepID=UPI003712BE4B